MSNIYAKIFTGYLQLQAAYNRDPYFKLCRKFEKEQWLDPNDLLRIRLDRLKKILSHAINNSSYYKEKFADHIKDIPDMSSIADLASFPVLRREDLQNNSERILCSTGKPYFKNSSGGSTGNPVNFYHDQFYKYNGSALQHLFLSWMNVSRGDRTAVFWGADRDFHSYSLKEKLMVKLERVKALNTFDIDNNNLERFLKQIENFDPKYIFGYASSLEFVANYINQNNNFKIRPQAIRSAAEMLYPNQREAIEKAFGCPVYNFYGSREVNNLAAECQAHEGLHVFASGRIIEVVDKELKPLPFGEIGQLLVTDLTNFTFPFIRYQIGDMGCLKKKLCSCGRTYPLLDQIVGRSSDIITLGGKYIHGEYFTHLFYHQPEVKQFQVIQETENKLVLKIVTTNKQMDTTSIIEKIVDKIGKKIEIEIKHVDSIPVLKSGKYRFTINNTI